MYTGQSIEVYQIIISTIDTIYQYMFSEIWGGLKLFFYNIQINFEEAWIYSSSIINEVMAYLYIIFEEALKLPYKIIRFAF